MSEEEVPFVNVVLFKAGYSSSVKCSIPEEVRFENCENAVGKNMKLSGIEYDNIETPKLLSESVSFKSRMSAISPISKFTNNNYESFEETSPNPETQKPKVVNGVNYKTGAKQWSTGMSSKSTSSRGANLSTILEESHPNVTFSETDQIHVSSTANATAEASTSKEIVVQNDTTRPTSLQLLNKKKAKEVFEGQFRPFSRKFSLSDLSQLGTSISKRKPRRKTKLPIEQQIRIKEWTIHQLTNIEEARKHELVIEVD